MNDNVIEIGAIDNRIRRYAAEVMPVPEDRELAMLEACMLSALANRMDFPRAEAFAEAYEIRLQAMAGRERNGREVISHRLRLAARMISKLSDPEKNAIVHPSARRNREAQQRILERCFRRLEP